MEKDVLDFTRKLFQPELRGPIESYVRRRTSDGPLIVEFDPTTACNMTCPECISGTLLNQGFISTARVLDLVDEFARAGVKGVIFIGGGEPLAHKGMPAPIVCCRERGMAVGLTTNGTLIERHLSAIAQHVAWTRVSLDAATQSTFSLFRPSRISDSFGVVVRGMEKLAKQKTGLLGTSFLLMERLQGDVVIASNVGEVAAAARIAKDAGCDYFECKPAVDMNHNLIPLSEAARTRLRAQLDEIASLSTERFRVIMPDSTPLLLAGQNHMQPKQYTSCPSIELRTVVTPSGVYPCPYKRGHTEARIGGTNVPFDKFWRSAARHEATSSINPSTDCTFFCIRDPVNRVLHALAEAYEGGVDLLPYMTSRGKLDVFV